MNNNEILLLKLGEVVLKGLNRRSFEDKLVSNVRRRMKPCGSFQIYIRQSTIYVEPQTEDCDMEAAFKAARQVFGIVTVARAVPCAKEMDAIVETAKTYLADEFAKARTFKVESRRADKQFPMNSIQISQYVGGELGQFFNVKADMHHPDLTVYVEIREKYAYIHTPSVPGAGGLPIGMGGRAVSLLSGGLDSPVSSYMIARRGVELEMVHFVSPPYTSQQALDKVLEQDETFGIGMNGEISAVTFGLYAQEDITAADGSVIPADGLLEIVSVNENGQAVCSTDLPFGSFYLKELSTDNHYLLNGETFPFTFEYGGPSVAVVEISANDGEAVTNELIRGEIKGLKTDENGTGLGGAVIGLFKSNETEFTAENALATATSAEDGSFSFAGVPYGNWVLKELESPEGFVLSDEIFSVAIEEDEQVVEISLANERVYGDLRLTKVDKDYPDNKLTGAEFEVYRDTNGNKKLDEGDELLGKLEETSTGIYEMAHILYGDVFVKETKAPEGFLLDENAYYVEITENGKIYEVENEAGIGFTNMAQTGSLRIEKTSSDGKVEGFSFRVTGANGYDQTFKTDKNGEIFIEGLRVGDYTVSEVSDGASANYVLPADKKVTILADKTTVAQMHNELRDTPKTGDDSKPWLWAALMGVSAMGAAALGVAAYVGKRKKDNHTAK